MAFGIFLRPSLGRSWANDFFVDKPKIIGPLLAAPRDPQVKILFLKINGDTYFEPNVGGDVPFYFKEIGEDKREALSIMVRALFSPRFQFNSSSFDLINIDFIGGPQLTYRYQDNVFQLWIFHESSHKGPDVATRTGGSPNYSYEQMNLLYSRFLGPGLRIYFGPQAIIHSDRKDLLAKTSFRFGGDWHVMGLDPSFYFAGDFESLQRYGWQINTSLQMGYDLGPHLDLRRQRIFAAFYRGFSPQGQFSDHREMSIGLGLGITF